MGTEEQGREDAKVEVVKHICDECSWSDDPKQWEACRRGKPLTVGEFEDFVASTWKHK